MESAMGAMSVTLGGDDFGIFPKIPSLQRESRKMKKEHENPILHCYYHCSH
jgi:hypothetical protein